MEKEYLKKAFMWVRVGVAVIVLGIIALSSYYTVSEQESAVIIQFGKVIGESRAGLHFKIPFIQSVQKVRMTTNGMEFGYRGDTDESVDSEAFMITNDFNFVMIDFYVEWKVSNPQKYLFNSADPEGILRNILQSETRSVVSAINVDDVLTTAKGEIQTKVRDGVQAKLEEYDLGIVITNLALQDTEPPTAEVITAFKDVENAKQRKDTEINLANTYNNEVIPKARAEADKIIKAAEADKEARINEAKGQVARFNEMYKQYALYKETTKTRIYLETMEDILPGIKTIIDGNSDIMKIINMDQNTPSTLNEGAAALNIGGEGVLDAQ